MKMKFLITVPDVKYYLWQLLVQINNFRKWGYEENMHILIISYNFKVSPELKKILESKELKCHFYLFPDLRINKNYIVSSKPYLVKQFFFQNPQFQGETFFYTDPDVVFTMPIDFKPFMQDDIWYGADTRSYLNSKYIKSKGEQLFIELCQIAGVSPELVIENDENIIGASWIIKHSDFFLWDAIEDISQQLYDHCVATKDRPIRKDPKDPYPIQYWAMEMNAMMWIPWKNGIKTRISKDLMFSWANWEVERWYNVATHHNAGVVKEDGKNFCKVTWQSSPFGKEIKVSEKSIGSKYVEEIRDTEKKFPNLLW